MISRFRLRNSVRMRSAGSVALCLLILSSCAGRSASVPDTSILIEIQKTLDQAAAISSPEPELLGEDASDLLNELIPSLSLDEVLLTPIEDLHDITANNLPADVFFNSLFAESDYGVAVTPDVDVLINLTLPRVTIEEVMDIVAELYNLDIARRGNIYTVRPGGLRTRQFTIDYLNIQRMGNSNVQVNSGNNQNSSGIGGGNFGGNGFGNGGIGFGGFGGGNLNGGNLGGLGGIGGLGGLGGLGGGGAGGQISTTTNSDFWSDFETAISNLIGVESKSSSVGAANASFGGLYGGLGGGGAQNQSTVTDQGKSVLVIPQTGIIIVRAFPRELDEIEQFLNLSQEILQREVIIQVQILEVILNNGYEYALDFNTFGRQANDPVTGSGAFRGTADGLLGSTSEVAAELLAGNAGIDSISNPLEFNVGFTDFDAVFRFLQTRGTTQVVSSSQLRVLNNQKAIFQSGAQEIFQTQADTTTVTSVTNTTTNSNNNLQQFFTGISMDITPQISADGMITLHVHPVISAAEEQSKMIGGKIVPLPRTTTREIDSVIRAANGEIVVLGGLTFERNVNETAGVPGISQVPLLGDALEQKQIQSVKSEFIILLKPIIANREGDRQLLNESKERFRDINRIVDPFADN